jgi:hypothetical protein
MMNAVPFPIDVHDRVDAAIRGIISNPPQSRRRASIPILRELFGLSAGVVGKRLGSLKPCGPRKQQIPCNQRPTGKE